MNSSKRLGSRGCKSARRAGESFAKSPRLVKPLPRSLASLGVWSLRLGGLFHGFGFGGLLMFHRTVSAALTLVVCAGVLALGAVASAADWSLTIAGQSSGQALASSQGSFTLKQALPANMSWSGANVNGGGRWTLSSNHPHSGLCTLTYSYNGVPLVTYRTTSADIKSGSVSLDLVKTHECYGGPRSVTLTQ